MQIVDSTAWGVRSARIALKHPTGNKTVVLYPMLHVGESAFYTQVYAEAFSRDVALVEGVSSPVATWITQSYRWIGKARNIGLVVQPRYPASETCRAKIVHSDLSAQEFVQVWQQVPLWLRVLTYLIVPIVSFERRWLSSREKIAKGCALEDAESREELLDWSPEVGFLNGAILDARDKRLLEKLNETIDDEFGTQTSIAVVYGARHMRAVLHELTGVRGYRVLSADWMTVFSL